MEFYIIKQFIRRLIKEIFYYLRIILRKLKTFFKILIFVFIIVCIYYFYSRGGF